MNHGVKYGILAGVATSVYLLILQFAGLITNRILGLVPLVLLAVGIILAQFSFRKANGGIMGYGKALLVGVVATVVTEVIANVYYFIHLKFISSEVIEAAIDNQALTLEQLGTDPAQIEAAANSPIFSAPGFAIMGLVFGVVIGVIISLITAAITKKSAPPA